MIGAPIAILRVIGSKIKLALGGVMDNDVTKEDNYIRRLQQIGSNHAVNQF